MALPTLPPNVESLIKVCIAESTDTKEAVRELRSDPFVAARLVTLASNPAFGDFAVDNVEAAVMHLGYGKIPLIGLALCLNRLVSGLPDRQNFNAHKVATSSYFTATVAGSIAKASASKTTWVDGWEVIFAAAAVRDLHLAILTRVAPDVYDLVSSYAREHATTVRVAFYEIFEQRSSVLAELTFKAWRLPPDIVRLMSSFEYSEPRVTCNGATSALMFAGQKSREIGLAFEDWRVQDAIQVNHLPVLGLNKDEVALIVCDATAGASRLRELGQAA